MTSSRCLPAAPAGGSFWWTTGDPGPARPPARGRRDVDVAIVGGGFTGLWAAIALLDTDPTLRVAVLEADRVGWGASGRNGGFCEASLTHGLANGLLHFADEIDVLEAEGRRNLAELVAFVDAEGIDAELDATGTLLVASQPHEVDELRAQAEASARLGGSSRFLGRAEVQTLQPSPRWLGGLRSGADQCVMVNPAKLAWGLAAAAERRGALVFEHSRVTGLLRRAGGVTVRVDGGAVVEADH
ncbi:MAG: NAD(P)/FAD-dependent oxidoreductase, partial [Candidatus Limnocylindrales bacterium]